MATIKTFSEVPLQSLPVFVDELCDRGLLQLRHVWHGVSNESVVNSKKSFDSVGHLVDLVTLEVGVDVRELFHDLLGEIC